MIIKDIIKKRSIVYQGYIYQINKGNKRYITKNNLDKKASRVYGPIYYKRGFRDLYVRELSTNKIIPTLILNKWIKMPRNTFVPIKKRGILFDEETITTSYASIAKEHDLDLIKDAAKITKLLMSEKSVKVHAYKENRPKNFKEELNNVMLSGREKARESKLSIWYYFKKLKNKDFKFKKEEIKVEEPIKEEKVEEPIKEAKTEEPIKETKTEEPKVSEKIKELKKQKEIINEIKKEQAVYYFNSYWANKEVPRKKLVQIDTKNKSIIEIALEMEKNTNDYLVSEAIINGIKIDTNILKTKKDIIEYYNYKKGGEYPTANNAKTLIRTNRRLKK